MSLLRRYCRKPTGKSLRACRRRRSKKSEPTSLSRLKSTVEEGISNGYTIPRTQSESNESTVYALTFSTCVIDRPSEFHSGMSTRLRVIISR
jgi:hypothetical protein